MHVSGKPQLQCETITARSFTLQLQMLDNNNEIQKLV